MTNTGDTNFPDPFGAALKAEIEDALSGVQLVVETKYVIVAAEMDGHFDQPELSFSTLRLIYKAAKRRGYTVVVLDQIPTATRESVGDLVRNGLIEQRTYTHGSRAGRTTLGLTKLGMRRMELAKAAAARAIVHHASNT